MKLIVKCSKCRQTNKAPYFVNNRIDYAKKYGDNFSLVCDSCNETTEYHVDDIKAVDYSFKEIFMSRLIIFVVIFVVTSVLGYFIIGKAAAVALSLTATFISIVLVKKNDSSKKSFLTSIN